jgi:hypothetical protein
MEKDKKFNAFKFDHYGGLDVLHIEQVSLPARGARCLPSWPARSKKEVWRFPSPGALGKKCPI